jgi:thioredoxin-like negative regulator of GroEL
MMTAHVEQVNDAHFNQVVLLSQWSVLVGFRPQWSGPCRALAPILDAAAGQYGGGSRRVTLNVDENPIVEPYRGQAIPHFNGLSRRQGKKRALAAVSGQEIARAFKTYGKN